MYSSSAKQLRGKNLTNDDTVSLHEYQESKRSGDFCLSGCPCCFGLFWVFGSFFVCLVVRVILVCFWVFGSFLVWLVVVGSC